MHKMIIGEHSAKTACGIEISAFYPGSEFAQSIERGPSFKVTIDNQRVTCEECLKIINK